MSQGNARARAGAAIARTLASEFAAQAARTPRAIAVTSGAAQLTYGELDRAAGGLAEGLAAAGLEPDQIVGVCFEPSLDLIVAIAAVLRAGGVCLPLDPAYPPERLRFMASDARPVRLVGDAALCRRLGLGEPDLQPTDVAPARGAGGETRGVWPALTPQHRAYILYTSGSTGRPKGVEITHGALTELFAAAGQFMDLGPRQVWA